MLNEKYEGHGTVFFVNDNIYSGEFLNGITSIHLPPALLSISWLLCKSFFYLFSHDFDFLLLRCLLGVAHDPLFVYLTCCFLLFLLPFSCFPIFTVYRDDARKGRIHVARWYAV